MSIITYVHQLKDFFENNPISVKKPSSPKEKQKGITKIFQHKKKEKSTTTPNKKSKQDDYHKTSNPIHQQQQPQQNNKKIAPPPPQDNKKLYESHKQYMNPFDSSEEDDGVINPFSTIKPTDNTPIIEIKQNGEIIDALNDNNEYEIFNKRN